MEKSRFCEILAISELGELFQFIKKNDEFYEVDLEKLIFTKKVVIFGSGRFGKQILANFRKKGIEPSCFCDNDKNKWGKCIDGLYVFPPEYIKKELSDIMVVISMIMYEKVSKQLEAMNAFYVFADIDGTIGFFPSPILLNNVQKLIEVNNLFVDKFSKDVYLNIIKARVFQEFSFEISGNLFTHSIVTGPQYFDTQYFKYHNGEVLVDCGAYDGDSIVEFYKTICSLNINEAKVYAFEPDKGNYNNILNTVNSFNFKNVEVMNCGVGIDNYELPMEQISNCRSDYCDNQVKICKLDDCLKEINVSFIKMDIEGFELEALKGAEEIIKNKKPKLAISIYHNSNDLYEIPLYIKSIVPEYNFFLRHHSYNTFYDTILYAFIN